MSLKRSFEEYIEDTLNLTNTEIDKTNKLYKQSLDEKAQESDTDTYGTSSNEDDNHKFVFKNDSGSASGKENTMLYMFKKYEFLQSQCNHYKNLVYKMKLRHHSQENKQHYKALEFSNLLLDKNTLQEKLQKYKYQSFKLYLSFIANIFFIISFLVCRYG